MSSVCRLFSHSIPFKPVALGELISEIMRRDDNLSVHGSSNNFDNLDKAFVIFKLPGPGRLHRRVDFISAPKERYSAAILSWSGSMMFERDLK